ncbi:hypothetical protein [Nostoc sp.]
MTVERRVYAADYYCLSPIADLNCITKDGNLTVDGRRACIGD